MAGTPKPVKCKSCAKLLATISEAGLSPTSTATDAKACETCQQFLSLYHAMKAADAEYASFRDRRDNYRPKQDAYVNAKKTRMDFNNWLIDVDAGDHTQPSSNHLETREGDEQRNTKRSRSQSPKASTRLQPTSIQEQHNSRPALVQKRFRFSDDVELRDHYRPSQHYARSEETYVRGRYAPPVDGEHLDTSGSAKTFLKFTGMKKVGKEWIDVWKDDDEVEDKKGREESAPTFNASVPENEVQTILPNVREAPDQGDAVSVDARAQRLARRKSAGSDATTTRKNATVRNRSKRTNGVKPPILSEDVPTVSEPIALNIGADPENVERDAHVAVPSDLGEHADVASLYATKVENGLEGKEDVLSGKTLNDGFTTGEVDGGGEVGTARVEPSSATEQTHNELDLVVSMEPQDKGEDQHGMAKNGVEIPPEVVEKKCLEDCPSDITNANESIVVLHGRPQFPDISEEQSGVPPQNCGFGPINNEAPELHNPATHLPRQPTLSEARHSRLSFQMSPAHHTASHAQHIAADPATYIRNAGIDAGGEMLVMASRDGKDQPG